MHQSNNAIEEKGLKMGLCHWDIQSLGSMIEPDPQLHINYIHVGTSQRENLWLPQAQKRH